MTSKQQRKRGSAFVGISLDSKLFSRAWVRSALSYILSRHQYVLFLLADDLLRYTRTAYSESGNTILRIKETSNLINSRRLEFEKFLNSEIKRLDIHLQKVVRVKPWHSFSDYEFVHILRQLQIAYATILPFQNSVNILATQHVTKIPTTFRFPGTLQTSVAFLLDEVAMCLRITELDDFSFEYYPTNEINILSDLYDKKFSQYGLSIESITGKPKHKRRFCILNDSER